MHEGGCDRVGGCRKAELFPQAFASSRSGEHWVSGEANVTAGPVEATGSWLLPGPRPSHCSHLGGVNQWKEDGSPLCNSSFQRKKEMRLSYVGSGTQVLGPSSSDFLGTLSGSGTRSSG